jgi:alpha 1,3-glucosidase
MFPNDPAGFDIDSQYYIGDSGLLVRPAVDKDIDSVQIYLAEDRPYYNYFTHEIYQGATNGKTVTVPAPLTEQMPLLQRGGSILAIRARTRRAAELSRLDPFTLVIALDKQSGESDGETGDVRAEGTLYLDDGQTYEYESGEFVWRRFEWLSHDSGRKHILRSIDEAGLKLADAELVVGDEKQLQTYERANRFAQSIQQVRVEKLVVLGLDKEPKSIRINAERLNGHSGAQNVEWHWNAGISASATSAGFKIGSSTASELIVKDPAVPIISDWSIEFE